MNKCPLPRHTDNCFMANIWVNLCYPTPPVQNWRMLEQSFAVCMHLLMVTSAFGLGRRLVLEFSSTVLPTCILSPYLKWPPSSNKKTLKHKKTKPNSTNESIHLAFHVFQSVDGQHHWQPSVPASA